FGSKQLRLISLLSVAVFAAACQTASPPAMSVEEAKRVTTTISDRFVPPPRTITDISVLLTPRGIDDEATFQARNRISDARYRADQAPPPIVDPAELGRWFFERGRAARRIFRIQQAIDDFTRAADLVKPGDAKLPGFYGAAPSTVA